MNLECCLTSNVLCGTSKSYEDHHVQEWLKNDLPFSISVSKITSTYFKCTNFKFCLQTDDKGVFSTNLSDEYFLAQQHFNLSKKDLWNIAFTSIDSCFASDEEKCKLKLYLQEWKQSNM